LHVATVCCDLASLRKQSGGLAAAVTQPWQSLASDAESHVYLPVCNGALLTWFARPQDRGKELKLPESQVKAAAVQSYALYYGAPGLL